MKLKKIIRIIKSYNYDLIQTYTEVNSQLDFLPNMITQAINANRPVVHNFDDIRSITSAITENFIAQNSHQSTSTGFQSRTQSTSVTLNPKMNNTESTKSISPNEVTGISIPSSSALIPAFTIPLQVPTKTCRSNSDTYK